MSGFRPPETLAEIPTTREMVAAMDRSVAGLEDFKKRLAVVLREHMVAAVEDRDWRPENILIIGPTGAGKTYTLKKLLEAIPVVWCETAATEYSDTGYHGRDLPTMYLGLTNYSQREMLDEKRRVNAQTHRPRAERWGVVLLDEFDKLRTNKRAVAGEREVGKILQFELLKLSEGTEAQVQENPDKPGFLFRTHHVLHIAMGAFEGLNKVISDFDQVPWTDTLYTRATPEDIIEYGFLQELVGRFATILTLPALKIPDLERILIEQLVPTLVAQYADDGIELVVDGAAILTVANEAQRRAIGARSLAPILRTMLWRARYEARPGCRIVLDGPAATMENARVEYPEAA